MISRTHFLVALSRIVFVGTVMQAFVGQGADAGTRIHSDFALREGARRPDIVMLFADDMRRDMLGAYGGQLISTPAMDRLGAAGLIIDNAVAPSPQCSPYRGMLLTGRYPTHSGLLNNNLNISPIQNPNSIAHVLKGAGYETAFIGKWHLAEHSRFILPGPERMGFDHWEAYTFHMDFSNYWFQRDTPERIYSGKYETDTIVDQGIAVLESREESDKPLFMIMMAHPPHPPFSERALPPEGYEGVPKEIAWSPNVPLDDNPRSVAEMRVYLAMIRNFDRNVERFLDYLEQSGRDRNTLLILGSDHGEMHGSHGRVDKKMPYAEAVDVPLIFRWPGVIEPGRTDAVFTPLDFLPTLAALVGASIPTEADGVNLYAQLFRHEPAPDRAVLLANYSSHWNFFRSDTPETAPDWRCWPEWRGVRTKRYTYARWLNGTVELYDNLTDPFQLTNIARAQPERTAEMEEKLTQLLAEAHDEFLPGTAYQEWFNDRGELIRTGLGPVKAPGEN